MNKQSAVSAANIERLLRGERIDDAEFLAIMTDEEAQRDLAKLQTAAEFISASVDQSDLSNIPNLPVAADRFFAVLDRSEQDLQITRQVIHFLKQIDPELIGRLGLNESDIETDIETTINLGNEETQIELTEQKRKDSEGR